MIDISKINYEKLDRPEIINFLFYPRPETTLEHEQKAYREILIPVEDNVHVGARLYHAGHERPMILFFHGNGEIVADYHDLGDIYNQVGFNFFPVDYRGYGKSGGSPSITTMMRDCHIVYDYMLHMRKEDGYTGPLVIMGRSLGSASALEIASHYGADIDGLIIESGFAYAIPLMELLGIDAAKMGISERDGFNNVDKIKDYSGPTLIIHAEHDHIIPFSDAEALHAASRAKYKQFLAIPGANHNTILAYGLSGYMRAIQEMMLFLAE